MCVTVCVHVCVCLFFFNFRLFHYYLLCKWDLINFLLMLMLIHRFPFGDLAAHSLCVSSSTPTLLVWNRLYWAWRWALSAFSSSTTSGVYVAVPVYHPVGFDICIVLCSSISDSKRMMCFFSFLLFSFLFFSFRFFSFLLFSFLFFYFLFFYFLQYNLCSD